MEAVVLCISISANGSLETFIPEVVPSNWSGAGFTPGGGVDRLMNPDCGRSAYPVVNGTTALNDRSILRHPIVGTLLALFAAFTTAGNVFVIAAVARERYLRSNVTNFFIVSLALADLVIGAIVMPFSISLEISDNRWMFGNDWCDIWHSLDVLASTASILNLSVIALDRYWAITDPIAYTNRMTKGRAAVLIGLVWVCSATISFPAIAWWRHVQREPPLAEECFFTEDSGYLIFSSLVSFYFPLSIILYAYYRIYRAATEQIRSLNRGSKILTSSTDGVNSETLTLRIHRGGKKFDRHMSSCSSLDTPDPSPPSTTPGYDGTPLQHPRAVSRYIRQSSSSASDRHPLQLQQDRPVSRLTSRRWKNFAVSRKFSRLAKEHKAAKTLGIVMGVFVMCWVPFFITNFLFGACGHGCVLHAEHLFRIFAWLGYINSGMNPVIYACSMRDFRRALTRLSSCFCCFCWDCCCRPARLHRSSSSSITPSFYSSPGYSTTPQEEYSSCRRGCTA